MICSKTKLGSELDRANQLLIENGYPDDATLSCIMQKFANFAAERPCGPEKCLVYLVLPWQSPIMQHLSLSDLFCFAYGH